MPLLWPLYWPTLSKCLPMNSLEVCVHLYEHQHGFLNIAITLYVVTNILVYFADWCQDKVNEKTRNMLYWNKCKTHSLMYYSYSPFATLSSNKSPLHALVTAPRSCHIRLPIFAYREVSFFKLMGFISEIDSLDDNPWQLGVIEGRV